MNNSNLGKIHSFDYLRAICCLVVVAIHTNISSLFTSHENLANIITYNLFDLAVPVFFQTALVLFFINRRKYQDYFLKKRVLKLIKLYLFWGLFAHLFNLMTINQIYINYLNQLLDLKILIRFMIQDGYSNPFYFFFSLLLITSLAELFAIIIDQNQVKSEIIAYTGLIISCLIVFLLPLSTIFLGQEFYDLSQSFNPLNFIPYIFSSFLITNNLENKPEVNNNYKQILILIIISSSLVFMEWQYISQPLLWGGITGNSLPVYSRLSLVFSAWLITLISLNISYPPHHIFKSLSNLSLGIYCLHSFLYLLLLKVIGMSPSQPYLIIIIFLIVILLSVLLTNIFKKIPLFQDYI
ncbi:acyltransferase [Anabaena sp. UHCC 0204]|uniref:acyltransferase family protein n=1 Tax=Anabaena sp. UHCC 0204 TaxID=2590009 RepID=UPI001446A3A0|nr:acyltransferase [Anabaena sp. UHCC 0204]MTJ08490.1 acyltransferase [Anabaena sp. UHCC 0204]